MWKYVKGADAGRARAVRLAELADLAVRRQEEEPYRQVPEIADGPVQGNVKEGAGLFFFLCCCCCFFFFFFFLANAFGVRVVRLSCQEANRVVELEDEARIVFVLGSARPESPVQHSCLTMPAGVLLFSSLAWTTAAHSGTESSTWAQRTAHALLPYLVFPQQRYAARTLSHPLPADTRPTAHPR